MIAKDRRRATYSIHIYVSAASSDESWQRCVPKLTIICRIAIKIRIYNSPARKIKSSREIFFPFCLRVLKRFLNIYKRAYLLARAQHGGAKTTANKIQSDDRRQEFRWELFELK